jgi:two-component system response regulator FlrC
MSEMKVLIVEDDESLRDALLDTLMSAGIPAEAVGDAGAALHRLESEACGLVISDVHMPKVDGIELLTSIKRKWPYLPVILMTAFATVSKAVAAMREGAIDYIVKPFDAAALISMVRHQLSIRAIPDDLVAEDPESKRLLALAARIARSDATVLLTGASGTGKEVYARFIRSKSARAEAPYVAINCAAIPENMLEATLFGHERGAFTGALSAHAGKFEQAQGGTLLLDEISEMDLGLQAKILRVLQEREVERLGGNRTIALDVRVIATSNRDLPAEVKAGRFRGDLFYRLNVMSLVLPDLARRRGDILPLAYRALSACGRAGAEFSVGAQAALLAHSWPGNVRELANTVQRAALLAGGDVIDEEALGLNAAAEPEARPAASVDAGLDHDLKEREREMILSVLRMTAGSRKLAAERLGISARTLRHKLQQFKAAGLKVPRFREQSLAEV